MGQIQFLEIFTSRKIQFFVNEKRIPSYLWLIFLLSLEAVFDTPPSIILNLQMS